MKGSWGGPEGRWLRSGGWLYFGCLEALTRTVHTVPLCFSLSLSVSSESSPLYLNQSPVSLCLFTLPTDCILYYSNMKYGLP